MKRFSTPIFFEADAGAPGGDSILTEGNQGTPGSKQQDTNNAGDAGNNPPAGEGTQNQPPGWLSGLTSDLRDNDLVKGAQKPSDFVKAALGWKAQLDKSIVRPGKDATPEQVLAYHTAMGIPAKAEDYGLTKNELVSDEFIKAQSELYLAQGLSKDQAKAMHEHSLKHMQDGASAIKAANLKARTDTEATLKAEYGDKYDQTLNDARNALRRFASPEDMEYLNNTGLGNDAGLIKMFANIQSRIGGDSLLGGGRQGNAGSATSEIKNRFPNSPQMLEN